MANKFADWMIKEDGGQKVVREFQKNGIDLYTRAPLRVDPLERVKRLLSRDALYKVDQREPEA